ncbi:MAG: hypothetical protein ACD_12C00745G0001 [uncultured bacterium]|nr:MAG: hypothetical protein ACD_12C00745G0001 [uncultured bacterium]
MKTFKTTIGEIPNRFRYLFEYGISQAARDKVVIAVNARCSGGETRPMGDDDFLCLADSNLKPAVVNFCEHLRSEIETKGEIELQIETGHEKKIVVIRDGQVIFKQF